MDSFYDYKKFAILYVDDEEKSLKYFARAFGDQFTVLTASNAQDGLKVLQENRDRIGLLITDQRITPDPVVRLSPASGANWSPDAVRQQLLDGNPRIYTRREHHYLVVRTHCLHGDEPEIVALAIRDLIC
jgi:CheY-like chemotaxis protein